MAAPACNALQRQHDYGQGGKGGELGKGAAHVMVEQMIGRGHVQHRSEHRRLRPRRFLLEPGMHGKTGSPEQQQRRDDEPIRHRQRVESHHADKRIEPERQGRIKIEGRAAKPAERLGHPPRIEDTGTNLIGELLRPVQVRRRTVAELRAQKQRWCQQERRGQHKHQRRPPEQHATAPPASAQCDRTSACRPTSGIESCRPYSASAVSARSDNAEQPVLLAQTQPARSGRPLPSQSQLAGRAKRRPALPILTSLRFAVVAVSILVFRYVETPLRRWISRTPPAGALETVS